MSIVNSVKKTLSNIFYPSVPFSEKKPFKSYIPKLDNKDFAVYMPTKETTFSENARASYQMFLDKYILPVIGDTLLTEVTPAIGGETASEDIINFLLQGFEGDVNRIWESNIFGKSLNDIAEEGLTGKIQALPEHARRKLRLTLERIINEGSGGLICILL